MKIWLSDNSANWNTDQFLDIADGDLSVFIEETEPFFTFDGRPRVCCFVATERTTDDGYQIFARNENSSV